MSRSAMEKFITRDLILDHQLKNVVKNPVLLFKNQANNFTISWWAITEPFVMEDKTFYHDFDQFIYLVGGDVANMPDLGGEVEFTMGETMESLEKFVFTTAAIIYIPKGLLHSPLNFKKINDPRKPILFQDMSMTTRYRKFFPGSDIPYDQHNEIITEKFS
ncbi:MAG: hypothetical protein SVV67_00210 [Bacillota bacterium]|nr:hypothetical protein [Bacillota bacterium]